MEQSVHPAAIEHLPIFITPPGQTDYLFVVVVVFMLVVIFAVANLYFQLHAVPERIAHKTNVVQMEIVAVLALISLFTHNHLFWIAGLLLAFIKLPDYETPLSSIARSLGKLSGRDADEPDDPALLPDEQDQDAKHPAHGTGHAAPDKTDRKEA